VQDVSQLVVLLLGVSCSSVDEVISKIDVVVQPGTLMVDVGPVKVGPVDFMRRLLPCHIDIVETHPLFGPQSAATGINGLKIAVCPVQGTRHARLAAFLRRALGLTVIMTTPEAHDKEAAVVQGLTHLIAKVLLRMGPLPTRMTTRSFDLLSEAISMVQHDAPDVFEAIEKTNPYAAPVRRQFFDLAAGLSGGLEASSRASQRTQSG